MTPAEKSQVLIQHGWEPVMEGDHELWLDPEDETRDDPSTFKQAWYVYRMRRRAAKVVKEKAGT